MEDGVPTRCFVVLYGEERDSASTDSAPSADERRGRTARIRANVTERPRVSARQRDAGGGKVARPWKLIRRGVSARLLAAHGLAL